MKTIVAIFMFLIILFLLWGNVKLTINDQEYILKLSYIQEN